MTALIWLFGAVVYLILGVAFARRNLAASWNRARSQWVFCVENQREDVRIGYLTMLFLWPVRIPANAILRVADAEINAGDPKAIEQRMAQQQQDIAMRDKRIAELERDLGIK